MRHHEAHVGRGPIQTIHVGCATSAKRPSIRHAVRVLCPSPPLSLTLSSKGEEGIEWGAELSSLQRKLMAMATSTFSPHPLSLKPQLGPKPHRLHLAPFPRLRTHRRLAAAGEAPVEAPPKPAEADPSPAASNGSAASAASPAAPVAAAAPAAVKAEAVASPKFQDSRWVNGTWDLSRFGNTGGAVDWDAVIDAGEMPLSPSSPLGVSRFC